MDVWIVTAAWNAAVTYSHPCVCFWGLGRDAQMTVSTSSSSIVVAGGCGRLLWYGRAAGHMRACCVGAKTDKYERESRWVTDKYEGIVAPLRYWILMTILYYTEGRVRVGCTVLHVCAWLCTVHYACLPGWPHMWWWWTGRVMTTVNERNKYMEILLCLSLSQLLSDCLLDDPSLLPWHWHLASD
jgi:hypothetical protein